MNIVVPRGGPVTADEIRGALTAFGRRHPEVLRLQLFGGVARGEMTAQSGVDLVVELAPEVIPRGSAGFAFLNALEGELAAALNVAVNLITGEAVRAATKAEDRSLARMAAQDAHVVYEAKSAAA